MNPCPKCRECELGIDGKPGCDSPPAEWWEMQMDYLDSIAAFEKVREPGNLQEWQHDYGSYRPGDSRARGYIG